MNGFIHGVRYVNGFAYYKLILAAIDTVVGAAVVVLTTIMVKKYLKLKKEEDN